VPLAGETVSQDVRQPTFDPAPAKGRLRGSVHQGFARSSITPVQSTPAVGRRP
jgi:hypothetical protein